MQRTTTNLRSAVRGLAAAATFAAATLAGADAIDCADLFLPHGAVAPGSYPRTELAGGDTLTSVGSPVVDVRIVPPNVLPETPDFVCGVDYEADLTAGTASLTFHRAGPYFVQFTRLDGTQEGLIVGVDARFRGDEATCGGGAATEIPCTTPHVAVVSSTLGFEHTWGDAGKEASNAAEAKEAICDAYEANDEEPVDVVIDAHGSPGSFTIGTEKIDKDNVDDFMDGLEGKIGSLTVLACSVAAGDAGEELICKLEEGLGCEVTGYTGANSDTVTAPPKWYTEGEPYSWEEDEKASADLDGSGFVDGFDLGLLLSEWGQADSAFDLSGDGIIDGTDLGILLSQWGEVTVPSPCPGEGDCCEPNGSAGCEDEDCCNAVCEADPFCCDVAWDGLCAKGATLFCPSLCQDPNEACGDTLVSQSFADDIEIGVGVACAPDGFITGDNAWARSFDLSLVPDLAGNMLQLNCVQLGIETNSGSDIVGTFTLYLDLDGGAPIAPGIDLKPIMSMPVPIPAGTSQAILELPLPPMPALSGLSLMVAELAMPPHFDGGVWPGCNTAGEDGPTYIRSNSCDAPEFLTMADVGFPQSAFVMHLQGDIVPGGIENCPAEGDCNVPHNTPGCDDAECCELICTDFDPGCCMFQWDQVCADAAQQMCGGGQQAQIFHHEPFLAQNDAPVFIEGDGFPMDLLGANVFFISETEGKIPVEVAQIIDLDNDGDGDVIEGWIDGIFNTELGMSLELYAEFSPVQQFEMPGEPQALLVAGEADNPLLLLSPDESQGDEDEPSTVSNRGRADGEFVENQNELLNTYRVCIGPDSWAANSTYTLSIQFYVRYKDTTNGQVKREKYKLAGSKIATDGTPTAAECLDAIANKMNAMMNASANTASRLTVFQNFEWVRDGNYVVLKKKGGSPANIRLLDYGGKTKKPVVAWKKD